MLGPECHEAFTSKHLAKVLDKCFKLVELDDHVVKETKERGGQTVEVERTVKGLVGKCLEKDGAAFKALESVRSKPKEQRLSALVECRPAECRSAVDLLLWLIEVVSRGVARGGVHDVHWGLVCDVGAGCAEQRGEAEGPVGVGGGVRWHDGRGRGAAGDQQVQTECGGARAVGESGAGGGAERGGRRRGGPGDGRFDRGRMRR